MIKFRQRIFEIIQIGNRGDILSRGFDYIITVAIFLNLILLIAGTFSVFKPWQDVFSDTEHVIFVLFLIEIVNCSSSYRNV